MPDRIANIDELRLLGVATQTFPFPHDLYEAWQELHYGTWEFTLTNEDRGQGCVGLTFNVYPDKPDSYHPENHVRTVFLYPVPAASFNRESWEEWIWERIEETEKHERAEWFKFNDGTGDRRPYKPAHADGWNPGVVRTVVSDTVTNTPNAGRLVVVPCPCGHGHPARMGEHFTVARVFPCPEKATCGCSFESQSPPPVAPSS